MLGNFRALGRFIAQRKLKIGLVALLIFAGYFAVISAVLVLKWGAAPNYFRLHSVPRGYQDTFYLFFKAGVPWGDFAAMLTGQPIFEFGLVQREARAIIGLLVVDVHMVLDIAAFSALGSIYLLLLITLIRLIKEARRSTSRGAVVGSIGSTTASSLGVATGTTVAAGACCGVLPAPILLSSIGLSGGVGLFLTENSEVFGAIGLGILFLSSLWLSGRVRELGVICPAGRQETARAT